MHKKTSFLRDFQKIAILVCVFYAFFISPVFATLPAGYTELEYIESTGTQYIDIPFTFDNTDEMYAEVALLVDFSELDRYFISPTSWNTNNNRFALGGHHPYGETDTGFHYGYGDKNTGRTSYNHVGDRDFHIYHYVNKTFSMVDLGIVRDESSTTWGGETTNLRLFYGYNRPSECKIKNIWHKRSNEYLYNFIPAKRNSDNTIGMYDTVSGTFFTNQGTGSFVAGPVIIDPDSEIQIATTKFVDDEFKAAEDQLATTVQTIESVVSRTIAQTGQIQILQDTKQTRPDESCPANMKCLLVQDEDGTPHWYPIIEP